MTVSAATRQLITASSVASTAAAKNGLRTSSRSRFRWKMFESGVRDIRAPVLNARKISPLP